MADAPLTYSKYPFLKELGLEEENPGCYNGTWCGSGSVYTSLNPTTGEPIARVRFATGAEYQSCIAAMEACKDEWALTPAPKRGEIVRQIGEEIRANIRQLDSMTRTGALAFARDRLCHLCLADL